MEARHHSKKISCLVMKFSRCNYSYVILPAFFQYTSTAALWEYYNINLISFKFSISRFVWAEGCCSRNCKQGFNQRIRHQTRSHCNLRSQAVPTPNEISTKSQRISGAEVLLKLAGNTVDPAGQEFCLNI